MGINISKNEVRIYFHLCQLLLTIHREPCDLSRLDSYFAKISAQFHKFKIEIDCKRGPSRFTCTQLHELFQLHSDMTVNKTLINMQLAATHIAFMLQQQTKAHVCHYNAFLRYIKLQPHCRQFQIFLELSRI